MLEQITAWEREGRWAEIRQHGPALLAAGLQGDQLARAYLAVAKAWEETATCPADYQESANLVLAAVAAAVPGSFMHTWALGRAAATLSDVGRFEQASEAAWAFLAQVETQPKATPMLPWVHFALGQVLYYKRRPVASAQHFRTAMSLGADGRLTELCRLWLAWSLAAAGQITAAFAAIPCEVHHVSHGHVFAAMARVCLAAQDLKGARTNARLALRSHEAGDWSVHDSLQAAELHLILRNSAYPQGGAGSVRLDHASKFALCSEAVLSVLAASLGRMGGVWSEAASVSRGLPVGHKRSGLLGAVG